LNSFGNVHQFGEYVYRFLTASVACADGLIQSLQNTFTSQTTGFRSDLIVSYYPIILAKSFAGHQTIQESSYAIN
jgi:hypothetical protein